MAKHKRKFRTKEEKAALVAQVKTALEAGKTIKEASATFGITDAQFRDWQGARSPSRRAKPTPGVQHIQMSLPQARNTVLVLYGSPADIREALSSMERLQ
jgi:transposase-like protein